MSKTSAMEKQTTANLRAALALNIKALRAQQGIAQEALALEAGVHRTMLSKIERAITNPSLDTLVKLSNTLEVSVADLLRPTK